MNLSVCSTTLREIIGEASRFPDELRALICDAASAVSQADMETMRGRHESDPENFDGRIEQNLRSASQAIELKANCRISEQTKFNNDLVIEANGNLVCMEIEKGQLSRFEFDILKMQAFAGRYRHEQPKAKIFGAFLVPADNIVARHISGNPRESSYTYLCRLLRLVGQINPFLLDDVLVAGYGVSMPDEQVTQWELKEMKRMPPNAEKKSSGNVVIADAGLLPNELLWDVLKGYPQELVGDLRKRLAAEFPKLREKINRNSRYLGYSNGGSDAMFVYVRKGDLLIDVRLSADLADDLRQLGFEVKPRDNYQGKSGWLTGLIVPHDTNKPDEVTKLAIEALQG